jgi:hypothetical protein
LIFTSPDLFQIKKKEIPIIKYKINQTGPKIQFGGLKEGFFSPSNQIGIFLDVKNAPKIPTSSQEIILIINFK